MDVSRVVRLFYHSKSLEMYNKFYLIFNFYTTHNRIIAAFTP